jgi:hypothetical protein
MPTGPHAVILSSWLAGEGERKEELMGRLRRVSVTGADGVIVGGVRCRIAEGFELSHAPLRPTRFPSHGGDIGILPLCALPSRGLTQVLPIATTSSGDAPQHRVPLLAAWTSGARQVDQRGSYNQPNEDNGEPVTHGRCSR